MGCFADGFGRLLVSGPGVGGEAWVVLREHRGHPGEDFPKILKRINATAAAGFDHGEHDGTALACIRIANEQPVLLAHGGGADGIFDFVVIDRDPSVLNEHAQALPQSERVIDGFAHLACRKVAAFAFPISQDAAEAFDDR